MCDTTGQVVSIINPCFLTSQDKDSLPSIHVEADGSMLLMCSTNNRIIVLVKSLPPYQNSKGSLHIESSGACW